MNFYDEISIIASEIIMLPRIEQSFNLNLSGFTSLGKAAKFLE
jgi:hypothetical protein